MWSQVLEELKEQGNIGTSLALCCPRHPDTPIEVSQPDDFKRYAPEGGCALRCDRLLKCGHPCEQRRHSDLRHDSKLSPLPPMEPSDTGQATRMAMADDRLGLKPVRMESTKLLD